MPDRAVVELMQAAVQAELDVEQAQRALDAAREARWSANTAASRAFRAQTAISAMTEREQQDAYADALFDMLREAKNQKGAGNA